jgi:branched-chain amino acid transport system substrate-binding protein
MKKFALVVVAFLFFNASAFSADVVKFGVNDCRSGPFKPTGDQHVIAIETAVKETNESGGVLGKRIELCIADNKLKADIAVQNIEKLITRDGCQVIIHGTSSVVGGAIAKIMPRYKKIYVDTGAMAMAITGEDFTPYTFRTCPNAGMLAKGLAQYFSKQDYQTYQTYLPSSSATKATVPGAVSDSSSPEWAFFLINQDYSWGHDVARYFEKFIKQLSPKARIVGKEFHKVFNKDFTPYIDKIRASGADYIVTGNWGVDLEQLIIQSRDQGVKRPFGCMFLDDDDVLSKVRKKALGCVTVSPYILGVDTPRAGAMEQSFYRNSGGQRLVFARALSYIGTNMYIEAVKKAGTFETEAVISAFEGLTWEGPAGTLTVRKQDHQTQYPMVVGEVVKKTKYYPFPYVKPIAIIPAKKVSLTPKESGWKPWKP